MIKPFSQQAAAIEEISSSLEEMSNMTKQNADHAGEAKAILGEANMIFVKVNENMTQMTRAIEEFSRSSEETGKIIKTIDVIAFQTNLLALNGAVEAAKNTSNLIQNTIKVVRNGNELTNLTQQAFKENVEISAKISHLVDEISEASQAQALQIKGHVRDLVRPVEGDSRSTLSTRKSEERGRHPSQSVAPRLRNPVAQPAEKDRKRCPRSQKKYGRSRGSPLTMTI